MRLKQPVQKFMPNETSAEDDFLAGLDNGSSDPFTPTNNDDLFPEETVEEPEVKEKPIPFAKDEKVQRFIERQVEKRLKNFTPTVQETFKEEVSKGNPDLVKAFEAIIGNDTDEKRNALKALEQAVSQSGGKPTKQELQEMLYQVQQESEEKEANELAEATNEIEEGFDDIENHYGIELTDKQKSAYKQFLLKVEPRGGYQEYPDFVETFEVFKNYVKANRPSNAQAKMLASRGMERSSSNSDTSSAPKRDGTKSLWQMLGQ